MNSSSTGTPAAMYLAGERGIDLAALTRTPKALRFHPRCYYKHIDTETGEVIEFFDAEIERLKTEIAKRLGFELVGHKLELYGHAIPGAEPVEREGLIYKRHAARVEPEAADS